MSSKNQTNEVQVEEPKVELPINFLYRVYNGEALIDSFLHKAKAEDRASKGEGLIVKMEKFEGFLHGINQQIAFPVGLDEETNEPICRKYRRRVSNIQRLRGKLVGVATMFGDEYKVAQSNWQEPWELIVE